MHLLKCMRLASRQPTRSRIWGKTQSRIHLFPTLLIPTLQDHTCGFLQVDLFPEKATRCHPLKGAFKERGSVCSDVGPLIPFPPRPRPASHTWGKTHTVGRPAARSAPAYEGHVEGWRRAAGARARPPAP